MSTRQYIGARYVPIFFENSATNDATWASNTIYEPLVMVTWNMNTYISKKNVPANIGNPAENPEYWVAINMASEQLNSLAEQVSEIGSDLETIEGYYSGGILDIAHGGTGASSASAALAAIGGSPASKYLNGRVLSGEVLTLNISNGSRAVIVTSSGTADYKSMVIINCSTGGAVTKADVVAPGDPLNFTMTTNLITITPGAATGYAVFVFDGAITASVTPVIT